MSKHQTKKEPFSIFDIFDLRTLKVIVLYIIGMVFTICLLEIVDPKINSYPELKNWLLYWVSGSLIVLSIIAFYVSVSGAIDDLYSDLFPNKVVIMGFIFNVIMIVTMGSLFVFIVL